MGGFNPAWFIGTAIGLVGLTELMFPERIRPVVRKICLPIAAILFVTGSVGLLRDFHAKYRLRSPISDWAIQIPVVTRGPTIQYYPIPLTLRELFDSDFPYLNVNHGLIFKFLDGTELTIRLRIYYDTDEKTKFVSAYIPLNPDYRKAYGACFGLPSQLRPTVDSIVLEPASFVSRPDESSPTALSELSLSRPVTLGGSWCPLFMWTSSQLSNTSYNSCSASSRVAPTAQSPLKFGIVAKKRPSSISSHSADFIAACIYSR